MALRLVEVIRGFSEGARLDWLHPSHGPFPDFAAVYQEDEHQFDVLVWDCGDNWVSMAIGPDPYHSGYPMSYRWWPSQDDKGVWCRPTKGDIYEVDVDHKKNVLRQIAAASVRTHIMTEPSIM